MKRLIIALAALIPMAASAESVKQMYPGPWVYEFNNAVTGALVQAKVKGCGIYRYRVSRSSDSEYLVYCSRDNENWKAYMVWPNINKVMGPYEPDPDLP
ncbi:hypothetical protein [Pseudomonas sp. RL_105y_Pfl2_101]|uniref:hypothetical protein n=1 Tax=Pseudomonas sp. RL_105y_Pfl2_101 TaxID=3088708 RepID=UPI0030D82859